MFNQPLPMIIRSAIREANGRIDKIAFDPATYRVFISGTREGAVFVLDLATHKTPHIIQNLPEPRDLIWQAKASRLIVACGGDGTLRTFKPQTLDGMQANPAYAPELTVQLSGEATDLSLEPAGERVWVAHARSISCVDLTKGEQVARIALQGRPDGLVYVQTPAGPRVFANVPKPDAKPDTSPESAKSIIIVIDPATNTIVDRWSLSNARGNSAINADNTGTRLFVVARDPALLIVLDTLTGREIARVPIVADADGVEFSAKFNRLYIPGGGNGGQVSVVQRTLASAQANPAAKVAQTEEAKPETDQPETTKSDTNRDTNPNITTVAAERYELIHTETTNAGARTAVLSESERLLLVAAPALGVDPTFIYVYLVGPE